MIDKDAVLVMVVDKVTRISRLVKTGGKTSSELVALELGFVMMVSRPLTEALARIIWIDVVP